VRHNKQEVGQAMVEYIVVTLMVVVVLLLASGEGAVLTQLNDAIKSFFRAYSYAMSIAPQGP
jgi:Flp pilus assembly pilin Flp